MFRRFHNATTIIPVDTLPNASDYKGQLAYFPRWPLVGSLPGTVVNGQRLRISGIGTYGTEYLGVGGSWVAQSSVTMGVWRSKKCGRFETGSNISCGGFIVDGSKTVKLSFGLIDSTVSIWENLFSNIIPPTTVGKLGISRESNTSNLALDKYLSFYPLANNILTDTPITITIIIDGDKSFYVYRDNVLWNSGVHDLVMNLIGDVNLGAGLLDGLVYYFSIETEGRLLIWDMEDVSGSSIPDRSGNGNTGTVTNVTAEYAWVPLS